MVDPRTAERLTYRALYFACAALVLFLGLLPLSQTPTLWPVPDGWQEGLPEGLLLFGLPVPDVLLCLTLLWVQRRPDFIPVWAVAVVFFLSDLLAMRPPGLWTLIVVVGTEIIRVREADTRDMPPWGEWAVAAVAILGMMLAYRLALGLFLLPDVDIGQAAGAALMTILLYPVLAGILRVTLGLRRAATGEVDQLGKRL